MITKTRVGNFYSIGKDIELDFLKGGTKNEAGYFSFRKNEKVSLINGFFGANASGKSNVLGSMVTLFRMMYTISPVPQGINIIGGIQLCQPNKHKDFENKPTKLGADFLFGNNYYTYDLEIKDGHNIIKETLFVTTLDKKSAKPKEIFTRKEAVINFGPEYKEYKTYSDSIKIQESQTFISHLITLGVNAVSDFIGYKNSFFLKTDGTDMFPGAHIARVLMLGNSKDKQDEFIKITQELMSCFDDSINGLKIDTNNGGLSIKVSHKNFSDSINLDNESAGTRELFRHIYDIVDIFKKGGIVVYDETNRYYHPDIEVALLSIFKNQEFNTKNAQLFFASHNHETFDLLELDQAYILEKENSCSSIYKLSEVEDLKKRDSLKKKYRLGMLGGTPDSTNFDYKLKQLL